MSFYIENGPQNNERPCPIAAPYQKQADEHQRNLEPVPHSKTTGLCRYGIPVPALKIRSDISACARLHTHRINLLSQLPRKISRGHTANSFHAYCNLARCDARCRKSQDTGKMVSSGRPIPRNSGSSVALFICESAYGRQVFRKLNGMRIQRNLEFPHIGSWINTRSNVNGYFAALICFLLELYLLRKRSNRAVPHRCRPAAHEKQSNNCDSEKANDKESGFHVIHNGVVTCYASPACTEYPLR